jgi:hypothetical protein
VLGFDVMVDQRNQVNEDERTAAEKAAARSSRKR